MSNEAAVSFTVRRPSPISRAGSSGLDSDAEPNFKVPALPRHLATSSNGSSRPSSPLAKGKPTHSRSIRHFDAEGDSSDEEGENVDEIVTGFDKFGVQRPNEKKPQGPLVIPALANRDWREVARKRKAGEMYVPSAGAAKTGADGSVGGLGTRDSINSGPQFSGLIKSEKKMRMDVDGEEPMAEVTTTTATVVETREETEEERAMRALISGASGADAENEFTIGAIPSASNAFTRPLDEADAFRQDVVTRPDEATLNDYARTPVEQFGEALLRGMGWKPGQAASRKRVGPVEPYLPAARPALLGIGAKEREAVDDGSKTKKPTRPERKYVPLVRKEREQDGASSEPERNRDRKDGDGDYDRDRKDKDRKYDSDRERKAEKGRDRNYEYDRRRDRGEDVHDRDGRKEKSYERERERDRDRRRERSERDGEERRRERDRGDRDRRH